MLKIEKFQIMTEAMVKQEGLGERTQTVLEGIRTKGGDNCRTLRMLGQLYRSKGNYDAAIETYTQLLDLHPNDQKSAYLCTVLSGKKAPPVPQKKQDFWPAPFVCIEDFLPRYLREKVLRFVLSHENLFGASEISNGVNVTVRSSRTLSQEHLGPIETLFIHRIKSHLPEVLPRLHLNGLTLDKFELQMTVHLDKDFYVAHQDTDGDKLHSRAMSFVYYFYSSPKHFEGGDLLLYDTNLEDNTCTINFTRVEPVNNRIVFFPSNYFHAVTSVSCPTNSFVHGRFTLNGWGYDKASRIS